MSNHFDRLDAKIKRAAEAADKERRERAGTQLTPEQFVKGEHPSANEKPAAPPASGGKDAPALSEPPLGVMPRQLWLEKRAMALRDAVEAHRLAGGGIEVMVMWMEELGGIVVELNGLETPPTVRPVESAQEAMRVLVAAMQQDGDLAARWHSAVSWAVLTHCVPRTVGGEAARRRLLRDSICIADVFMRQVFELAEPTHDKDMQQLQGIYFAASVASRAAEPQACHTSLATQVIKAKGKTHRLDGPLNLQRETGPRALGRDSEKGANHGNETQQTGAQAGQENAQQEGKSLLTDPQEQEGVECVRAMDFWRNT